jgi:hypothetical protein
MYRAAYIRLAITAPLCSCPALSAPCEPVHHLHWSNDASNVMKLLALRAVDAYTKPKSTAAMRPSTLYTSR